MTLQHKFLNIFNRKSINYIKNNLCLQTSFQLCGENLFEIVKHSHHKFNYNSKLFHIEFQFNNRKIL